MLKKRTILLTWLSIAFVLVLTACGKATVEGDLQAKTWSVTATNGEAYQAEFKKDEVSLSIDDFERVFTYKIEGDVITLEQDEEVISFEVSQKGDDYHFKAREEGTQARYGDLTLTPASK